MTNPNEHIHAAINDGFEDDVEGFLARLASESSVYEAEVQPETRQGDSLCRLRCFFFYHATALTLPETVTSQATGKLKCQRPTARTR